MTPANRLAAALMAVAVSLGLILTGAAATGLLPQAWAAWLTAPL